MSFVCKVADRLISSFGQDILDALYWTATEPKERKRDSIGVIPHFVMAVCYVCILLFLIIIFRPHFKRLTCSLRVKLLFVSFLCLFCSIEVNVINVGVLGLERFNSDYNDIYTSYFFTHLSLMQSIDEEYRSECSAQFKCFI